VADRWGPRASEGERANGRSALTERAHRAVRENGCAREEIDADNPAPPGSRRERDRVCGRGSSLIGGSHLLGDAGARGLAGLDWAYWAEMGFYFFLEFLMAFLFIFSMDFK
jgi:hypothetical protein